MATSFLLFTPDEFKQYLQETKFHRVVKIIQNHHTLEPSYRSFKGNNHLALLKGMENYHVTERGFSQIAQNLTSFPDGKIALCRPLETIPAGIKGANREGICIENLGNFDAGKDPMSEAHRNAIIQMNAALCQAFRLIPSTDSIVYHHWYDLATGSRTDGAGATKSCPGTAFFGGNSVEKARTGFIPQVLKALADIAPTKPQTPPLHPATVTASTLNVRSGATARATLLKSLAQGIVVQVYEEKNGWARIDPSEQHWVSARYLQ